MQTTLTHDFFVILALLASALAGGALQWLVMWSRGETDTDFIEYLKVNRKNTIASLSAIIGYVSMTYSTGETALTMQLLSTYFTAGFTFDRLLNKAE